MGYAPRGGGGGGVGFVGMYINNENFWAKICMKVFVKLHEMV